jgi:hypothetical protein
MMNVKQTVIGDPTETGKQWLNHHDDVDYVNLKTNHHYTDSKEDLIKGVNKIADVVKVTLGAKGKNVLFNNRDGKPQITKDGITAARQVFSMNPFENMAIQIVREASEQTVPQHLLESIARLGKCRKLSGCEHRCRLNDMSERRDQCGRG